MRKTRVLAHLFGKRFTSFFSFAREMIHMSMPVTYSTVQTDARIITYTLP
uniref:Uncharacterized protein n=1 Tax=Arundo donax TaxID=35708 RepID=A0A0A9FBE4_ARUDO